MGGYTIVRSDEEINEVLNEAVERVDEGTSNWPGMSYEQGVEAAINWLIGSVEDNPMDD